MRAFSSASRARGTDVKDVAVVGGGAAGLTAAWYASKEGSDVVVLERTKECGKKVLMSGGTRCNVLPWEMDVSKDYFTSGNHGALRSIFSSWTVQEAKRWLEEDIDLPLVMESSSMKWFPKSQSSRDVRDALVRGCVEKDVLFRYHSRVSGLHRVQGDSKSMEDSHWRCVLQDGSHVNARNVVLAAGGSSFPKVGTDGSSYDLARHLGHTIHTPHAALTPLIGYHPSHAQLSGVSLDVALSVESHQIRSDDPRSEKQAGKRSGKKKKRVGEAIREGFLFTHKGFSGPAVLDLSHHFVEHFEGLKSQTDIPELRVNWAQLSEQQWTELLDPNHGKGGSSVANRLRTVMPQRLATAICEVVGILDRRLAELTRQERSLLIDALVRFPLEVTGHAGLDKAEVTAGGLSLDEINTKTMESKLHSNLFLCGEVLDCFGRIGGFNFYFAWVTGRLAGRGAARRAQERLHGG